MLLGEVLVNSQVLQSGQQDSLPSLTSPLISQHMRTCGGRTGGLRATWYWSKVKLGSTTFSASMCQMLRQDWLGEPPPAMQGTAAKRAGAAQGLQCKTSPPELLSGGNVHAQQAELDDGRHDTEPHVEPTLQVTMSSADIHLCRPMTTCRLCCVHHARFYKYVVHR